MKDKVTLGRIDFLLNNYSVDVTETVEDMEGNEKLRVYACIAEYISPNHSRSFSDPIRFVIKAEGHSAEQAINETTAKLEGLEADFKS